MVTCCLMYETSSASSVPPSQASQEPLCAVTSVEPFSALSFTMIDWPSSEYSVQPTPEPLSKPPFTICAVGTFGAASATCCPALVRKGARMPDQDASAASTRDTPEAKRSRVAFIQSRSCVTGDIRLSLQDGRGRTVQERSDSGRYTRRTGPVDGVTVRVGVGVGLAVGVFVPVGDAVGVRLLVAALVGVREAVGVVVLVPVTAEVLVGVCEAVAVGLAVGVRDGVAVPVGEAVAVGLPVAVAVPVAVGVLVGPAPASRVTSSMNQLLQLYWLVFAWNCTQTVCPM
jgi:hypothetical protein